MKCSRLLPVMPYKVIFLIVIAGITFWGQCVTCEGGCCNSRLHTECVAENTVCLNCTCVCKTGYEWDLDGGDCLPVPLPYGGICDIHGRCTGDFMCVNGTCLCLRECSFFEDSESCWCHKTTLLVIVIPVCAVVLVSLVPGSIILIKCWLNRRRRGKDPSGVGPPFSGVSTLTAVYGKEVLVECPRKKSSFSFEELRQTLCPLILESRSLEEKEKFVLSGCSSENLPSFPSAEGTDLSPEVHPSSARF